MSEKRVRQGLAGILIAFGWLVADCKGSAAQASATTGAATSLPPSSKSTTTAPPQTPDQWCRHSPGCRDSGLCSAGESRSGCVAKLETDCTQSNGCKTRGA